MKEHRNKDTNNNEVNIVKRIRTILTIQLVIDAVIIACVLLFFSLGMNRCAGSSQEELSVTTYEAIEEVAESSYLPTDPSIEETIEQSSELETKESTEPSTELPYTTIQTTYEPTIYISTEPTESSSEVIELTETSDYVPDVNDYDAELLAMVIYQEVGSDAICDECRRRVADIVLNRVDSGLFPNTIEGVLTQSGQYGNYSRTGVCWPSRASYDSEAHAVERARRIAREVLEGNHSELYGNGYVFQAGFTQGSEGFWCCGVYYGRIY